MADKFDNWQHQIILVTTDNWINILSDISALIILNCIREK